MDQSINLSKFRIYRLKAQDLYVAVFKDYWASIDYEVGQHGSLDKVPSDKSVRGIFFSKTKTSLEFDEAAQQNDFILNQLREIASS